MNDSPPRFWASTHGIRACWAHGMQRRDVYLHDARSVIGRRDIVVHVVGDLPNQLVMPLTFAGYEAVWHDHDWAYGGECKACERSVEQASADR